MQPNHQHSKLILSPHNYNKYRKVNNSEFMFHVNMHRFEANLFRDFYKILKPHMYPKQHLYFKILYQSQENTVHFH
jgi:hypothetical protein